MVSYQHFQAVKEYPLKDYALLTNDAFHVTTMKKHGITDIARNDPDSMKKGGNMDMNKRRDTIPEHFNSAEEAGEFWDSQKEEQRMSDALPITHYTHYRLRITPEGDIYPKNQIKCNIFKAHVFSFKTFTKETGKKNNFYYKSL